MLAPDRGCSFEEAPVLQRKRVIVGNDDYASLLAVLILADLLREKLGLESDLDLNGEVDALGINIGPETAQVGLDPGPFVMVRRDRKELVAESVIGENDLELFCRVSKLISDQVVGMTSFFIVVVVELEGDSVCLTPPGPFAVGDNQFLSTAWSCAVGHIDTFKKTISFKVVDKPVYHRLRATGFLKQEALGGDAEENGFYQQLGIGRDQRFPRVHEDALKIKRVVAANGVQNPDAVVQASGGTPSDAGALSFLPRQGYGRVELLACGPQLVEQPGVECGSLAEPLGFASRTNTSAMTAMIRQASGRSA